MSDTDEKYDLRRLIFEYRNSATEDAEGWCVAIEAFVAEKDARIAELETLMASGPHGMGCASQRGVFTISGCDCWKSKV